MLYGSMVQGYDYLFESIYNAVKQSNDKNIILYEILLLSTCLLNGILTIFCVASIYIPAKAKP